jgi:hypothetical protein
MYLMFITMYYSDESPKFEEKRKRKCEINVTIPGDLSSD